MNCKIVSLFIVLTCSHFSLAKQADLALPSDFAREHSYYTALLESVATYSPMRVLGQLTPTTWYVKYFSHAWELDGRTVTAEGFVDHDIFLAGVSSYYMKSSLERFGRLYPQIDFDKLSGAINAMNYAGSPVTSSADLFAAYKAGKPVLINATPRVWGPAAHALGIVIHGSMLFICNKGLWSQRPVEAFEIDPALLDSQTMADIVSAASYLTYQDDYWAQIGSKSRQGVLLKRLKAKSGTPACDWFEGLHHTTRGQTMGNCGWESVETAAYVLLAIPFAGQGNEGQRAAFEIFDAWQQFAKLETLESYVSEAESRFGNGAQWPSIQESLVQVFQKASQIDWRLDFFEKIVELRERALGLPH